MFLEESPRKKLEKYFVVFLVAFAVLFGISRMAPRLLGPTITLYTPHDGDIVASSSFEVSGEVSKVKEITLQGRPIVVDTEGHFRELLVANPPYTILVLTATDHFGASTTKTLRVIPQ